MMVVVGMMEGVVAAVTAAASLNLVRIVQKIQNTVHCLGILLKIQLYAPN